MSDTPTRAPTRPPGDPDGAVDFILNNRKKYAAAKAERRYLEEFRKTKKALLMGQSDAKAANAREEFAYAHPEYQELLKGLKAAIEVEEELGWAMAAAEIRVEIWRSREASNRQTDRTMR